MIGGGLIFFRRAVEIYSTEALEADTGEPVLVGPVEVPRRASPPVEVLDIEHPQEVILGDKVQLLGYNMESGFRPGDGIHLTLFWQCLEEMDERYTIFTHLIDGESHIWGQKDNEPADGFYPTTEWQKGEIVRDQYDLTIPLDAPPGEYQIEVGMYVAGMGERLKVIGEEEYALDDRILLERIEVGGSDFITMEEGNGKSDKERIWEAEFARGQDGSIRPVFDKFSGAIL